MAQIMLTLRNKSPLTRITDFFPNGDGSPVPASPVPSDSSNKSTGPKKPRRQGRRSKPVVSKTIKGGASSVTGMATPDTKSKRTGKTNAASKARKEEDNGKEPQWCITAFFPVRRSDRRGQSSAELKKVREKEIEEKIKTGCEDGLKVMEIEGKGRGVIATKEFEKDDFVVEYAGELVSITTAKQREQLYEKDEQVGCYMYYFCHKNKHYCIDATAESGKMGRLLNHSRKGNCHTKVIAIGDTPYLVLMASRHIDQGEELTYDYGDRSQKAIESHPWLKL